MAKETNIIFVYDTELLKKEEDDPNSAILYFYPTWVSDEQKTALCGQLMGTILCLRGLFSFPKIVALQSGKFYFLENQRYILAIGSDRNTPDWILEHRSKIVYSLLNFYHKSFVNLSTKYQNEALAVKMYYIFDVYLKIILFGGNIFNQVYLLQTHKSKSSSTIVEASTFLESCREFSNVLGGTILYHNKVVLTQLSTETTKLLVLSDPYRIKNAAESLDVDFELPEGIQLLQVYLTNSEFCTLLENSLHSHYMFQYLKNKNTKKSHIFKNHDADSSLLFTAVPEEEVPSSTETSLPVQKKPRPKSLNLRSISTDSNDSQYSYKTTPMTPFCGQNSIVDTPMTEFKTFVTEQPKDQKENKEEKQSKNEIRAEEINKIEPKQGSSLTNLTEVLNSIPLNPLQYSNNKNKILPAPKKSIKLKRSKTVHDPFYPIFRKNGMAASTHVFQGVLKKQEPLQFSTNKHRKSLTLPLKAMDLSNERRRYSTGVQLTPLMSKLTALALEEQNYSTKLTVNSKKPKNVKASEDETFQRCALFLYGEKDVVVSLVLKEEVSKDKDTIFRLLEMCKERLPQLEKHVRVVVESQNKISGHTEGEPYSVLSIDEKWDMVKRSGPWSLTEDNVLNTVHEDFKKDNNISEILIR